MKTERGIFLTIMLVVQVLVFLLYLYSATNQSIVQDVYGSVSSSFTPFAIVGFLIGIVSVAGLWMWKKWAIFTVAFAAVYINLIQDIVFHPLDTSVSTYFLTGMSWVLVFWSIYRKRELFK